MSQISGSWSAEVDLARIAEEIAQRTAVLVVSMLRSAPSGSETYEREPEPGQATVDPDRGRHRPDEIGMNGLPGAGS